GTAYGETEPSGLQPSGAQPARHIAASSNRLSHARTGCTSGIRLCIRPGGGELQLPDPVPDDRRESFHFCWRITSRLKRAANLPVRQTSEQLCDPSRVLARYMLPDRPHTNVIDEVRHVEDGNQGRPGVLKSMYSGVTLVMNLDPMYVSRCEVL